MNKKLLSLMLGIILILSVTSIISAQTDEFIPKDADNAIGRFFSKIKFSIAKSGGFTVYGDELGCSKFPTETVRFKRGEIEVVPSSLSSGGFLNFFRGSPFDGEYSEHPEDSRQYLGEDYVVKGRAKAFTCDAGNYWGEDCYVDFYACSNEVCQDDSDCSGSETCDKTVLSQSGSPVSGGVCRVGSLTHRTEVFKCEDATKTLLGSVPHGDINFCTDPSDSKYLIGDTDQCLPQDPSQCSQITEAINEEFLQVGTSASSLKRKTAEELAQSACITTDQCEEGSECQSIQFLIDSGKLTDAEAEGLIDKSAIFFGSAGAVGAVGACIAGATALSISTAGAGAIVFPLCAVAGGTAGLGINELFESFGSKDTTSAGYCIYEGGTIQEFIGELAFFNITGDPLADGLIIIGGGILLVFLLLKR